VARVCDKMIKIQDIVIFSETALSQNQDRALITDDHQKKTSMLTKHLQHLEKEKFTQVSILTEIIYNNVVTTEVILFQM
jgi:hypothetical protein